MIPRTTEPPGAMEGSVQLYRLPWFVRGNEPLSEMNRGPLGIVVLSQPIPAAWPVLRTVTVRTNRADVFTWDLRRIGPSVAWCLDVTVDLAGAGDDTIGPVLRELTSRMRRHGMVPVTVETPSDVPDAPADAEERQSCEHRVGVTIFRN